jgi:adenine-specific DNA methylase
MNHPRLLIEEWLPAQAIGVECMRERSTGQQPPDKRLHIWWARRPLTVSRAAVLASLLPADFDRDCFERLLGFGCSSSELVHIRELMDAGIRVEGGFGRGRGFSNALNEPDLQKAYRAMEKLWGDLPTVLDSMAGGGSIPLEAARLGLNVFANEYNPVACSVLEATIDYPFRFGALLAEKVHKWGKLWEQRAADRLEPFYPKEKFALVHAYIFARTVPCPDTEHPTPLVPDWHLLKPKSGQRIVAEPLVLDEAKGTWTIRVREIGKGAGQLRQPPQPTYGGGKGVSLFTKRVIPADYIKTMAQQGKMGSVLYAIATKATRLEFRPPEPTDLKALEAAEKELERLRPQWERDGIIPTEEYPEISSDERPRLYGMPRWSDLFSPRQLLALGTLVEELRHLRTEIVETEGEETGEAVVHLLALCLDKFADYNAVSSIWHPSRGIIAHVFNRHEYSFKATFSEMATCVAGSGLEWAIRNAIKAYEDLAKLPRASKASPVSITQGSATNLLDLDDGSVTAVVVDPPYCDNVQYSELADFFYVWLKRTQGHRRPEWFSAYLCDKAEEAVVNISRHRENGKLTALEAREKANEFYRSLIMETFEEAYRVLRDEGILTVMFTHKKQEAWASLFESLIAAGFTITATWPVQTESQHSLHQAKKNAAQSTVLLAARKRDPNAGVGYFDDTMQDEIRAVAQETAARLRDEGLNAVDQLVGAFGPAMEVFTRYDEVRTDTGEVVNVLDAIQSAADAVADWRVEQLAKRSLEGVDAESRFVLLCWDVLGAAEFRFNEAMLLGRSVGMDVNALIDAGLVSKSSDKVKLRPAKERRRERPVRTESEQLKLFESTRRGSRRSRRTVHPNDEYFVSVIDMCHALALRYAESGGGQAGIGAVRGMALQQGWTANSSCAQMMEALVNAAPQAVRFPGKGRQKTIADEFPEFRAWHAMLKPLFGIEPPEWKEPKELQLTMRLEHDSDEEEE